MSTLPVSTRHSKIKDELEGKREYKFTTTSLRPDAYLMLRKLSREHQSSNIDFLSNILRAINLLSGEDVTTLLTLGKAFEVLSKLTEGLERDKDMLSLLPDYHLINGKDYDKLQRTLDSPSKED